MHGGHERGTSVITGARQPEALTGQRQVPHTKVGQGADIDHRAAVHSHNVHRAKHAQHQKRLTYALRSEAVMYRPLDVLQVHFDGSVCLQPRIT